MDWLYIFLYVIFCFHNYDCQFPGSGASLIIHEKSDFFKYFHWDDLTHEDSVSLKQFSDSKDRVSTSTKKDR